MDTPLDLFEPPAPQPQSRTLSGPLGTAQLIRTIYRNPLEIWGPMAYSAPSLATDWLGNHTVIVNDPAMIRHVLVDNVANYRMSPIRQRILRPILRDGLLTAEGDLWKRSRRAMAPVFTPRHIAGFARTMLDRSEDFASRYRQGGRFDIARDMTLLTFDIMEETLFSGDIVGEPGDFARQVDLLFDTMGRTDPLDLLGAPDWLPRLSRIRGRRSLAFFRDIVTRTAQARRIEMQESTDAPKKDFLTLLLRSESPDGLSESEIADNIITFIGAGHETTARALGWTLYCLANAPAARAGVEEELDAKLDGLADPNDWLDALPRTRAAFEEAMRLYPPAPSLNRQAIEDDKIADRPIPAGATVLVMPWLVHRHEALWKNPRAFQPDRFLPDARKTIDRYQYIPFGVGPRICIGASFAMMEGVIALATLLKTFRFDTYRRRPPFPVQRLTVQPDGGLPMKVSLRRQS